MFSKITVGDGYGAADRALAARLRAAGTQEEADQAARDDGHTNAEDAADWLNGRS